MQYSWRAVAVAVAWAGLVGCGSDGEGGGRNDVGSAGEGGDSHARSGGAAGFEVEGGAPATSGASAEGGAGAEGGVDAGASAGGEDGGASGGMSGAAATGGAAGAGTVIGGEGGAIELGGEVTVPVQPSGIRLRLDSVVYAIGDSVTLELDFGGRDPGVDSLTVALASPDSGDGEPVELLRSAGNRFESTAVPLTDGSVVPADGALTVAAGEMFHGLYFVDRSRGALADVEEDLVTDFALIATPGAPASVIEPELALTDDELDPAPGAKAVGTLLPDGGRPVQIATEELILFPTSDDELTDFLDRSGGTVIAEQTVDRGDGEDNGTAVLVSVDPGQADPAHLGVLRELFGESGTLFASREDVLSILALALVYQAEGFVVAVNPRLQMQGAPSISALESANVTHTMQMVAAADVTGPCVPGDPARACVENVPALWTFTALWDADEREVDVGVLDIGFAPNADFRSPSSGAPVQCDMTARGIPGYRCGAGAAEGPPTVGNSFFGDRSWHGTGVVTTIGGVVNDGFGAAGVAGLNAVPMLYKYDFLAYAFEIGGGLLRAVADGASVVNISGGYPCRVLTNVGPDFDICSVAGRAGICAIVTAGVHAAAATVCATLGPIPFVGPIACGAAMSGAVAATSACVATFALGDVRSPMASAIAHASRAGVPVVTIAGNRLSRESLPEVIRDLVDIDDARTESWGIVPAMIPQTIVAGAVNGDLDNVHFYGSRVDLWAPIETAYMSPSSVDDPSSDLVWGTLGGTSAAAPFITGVVASMQALNPSLDPATATLTDAQRRAIVPSIKELLTAEANTLSNAELRTRGYSDQPEERRLLVDPLAAVRAAAAPTLPDLTGYDPTLNFSEAITPNDTESDALPLAIGVPATGTIVTIPASGTATPATDEDWFVATMPDLGGAAPGQLRIELAFPSGWGNLALAGDGLVLESRGTVTTYAAVAEAGTEVPFRVIAGAGEDNVYRVTVLDAEPALPVVEILEPVDASSVCANTPVTLRASATHPRFPSVAVPGSAIAWSSGGTSLGTGFTTTSSFALGEHTVTARAYGSAAAEASTTFDAIDCAGEPPTVTILSPTAPVPDAFYDGFDEALGLWYVDMAVAGSGTDPEDGALTGSSLGWRTDRTDLQDGDLGTGANPTLRLYGDDCFGVTHTVRLEAVDSDGNPAPARTFQIFIYTLC